MPRRKSLHAKLKQRARKLRAEAHNALNPDTEAMLLPQNKPTLRTLTNAHRKNFRREKETKLILRPWLNDKVPPHMRHALGRAGQEGVGESQDENENTRSHTGFCSLPLELRQQILLSALNEHEVQQMTRRELGERITTLSLISAQTASDMDYVARRWRNEKRSYEEEIIASRNAMFEDFGLKPPPRNHLQQVPSYTTQIPSISQQYKSFKIKKGKIKKITTKQVNNGGPLEGRSRRGRAKRPRKCWFCDERHWGTQEGRECPVAKRDGLDWQSRTRVVPRERFESEEVGRGVTIRGWEGFSGQRIVFED